MNVATAAPLPVPPVLTVIDGGRGDAPVAPAELVELENAWIEVEAVAHEFRTFVGLAVEAARRIQVAIAKDRASIAGQLAHDLEVAAPLYARRAIAAEIEAEQQLDDMHPVPVA